MGQQHLLNVFNKDIVKIVGVEIGTLERIRLSFWHIVNL